MNNKFFNAAKSGDTLVMSFYNTIGESWDGEGATPAMVVDALKGNCKNIELHLNSPGGAAFDGVAIYNILKACSKPVNVVVDGMAASAASMGKVKNDLTDLQGGADKTGKSFTSIGEARGGLMMVEESIGVKLPPAFEYTHS